MAGNLCAADKPVIITWDAANLRLSWKCLTDGKQTCSIDFLKRTMQAGKKSYPLSDAEARQMAPMLIRNITEYAIASEDWFFEHKGQYQPAKPAKRERTDREIAKR